MFLDFIDCSTKEIFDDLIDSKSPVTIYKLSHEIFEIHKD